MIKQLWHLLKLIFKMIKSFSDDSDFEGTSPTGQGGKSGSKKERHFWQYNVQV